MTTREVVGAGVKQHNTPLTVERLAELGQEAAGHMKTIKDLEEERKALNTELKDVRGARDTADAKVNAGTEVVAVKVRYELEGSTIYVIRESDGEVLEERAATPDELQGVFSFVGGATAALYEGLAEALRSGVRPGDEFVPLLSQVTQILVRDSVEEVKQHAGDCPDHSLLMVALAYEETVGRRPSVISAIKERMEELAPEEIGG